MCVIAAGPASVRPPIWPQPKLVSDFLLERCGQKTCRLNHDFSFGEGKEFIVSWRHFWTASKCAKCVPYLWSVSGRNVTSHQVSLPYTVLHKMFYNYFQDLFDLDSGRSKFQTAFLTAGLAFSVGMSIFINRRLCLIELLEDMYAYRCPKNPKDESLLQFAYWDLGIFLGFSSFFLFFIIRDGSTIAQPF